MTAVQGAALRGRVTHGIEETIERVEHLYRTVTGREPPPPGPMLAPREVEARLTQRMDHLLGLLEPAWSPVVSVVAAAAEVVVRADLPGVTRQDVRAEVQGDVLVLRGERRDSGAVPTGPFLRALRLPDGARPERVTARLSDGVLELRMPVEARGSVPIDVA